MPGPQPTVGPEFAKASSEGAGNGAPAIQASIEGVGNGAPVDASMSLETVGI